jgi:hypothetical protein
VKKLFPEVPDVPPSVANRASRIVEKHLRLHHVNRARDLPEDAKIRLYRDLRFFFDSGSQPPGTDSREGKFSIRAFFTRLWEKIEDFLSASVTAPERGAAGVMAWGYLADPARGVVVWRNGSSSCEETG